jgi:hypothetical protein
VLDITTSLKYIVGMCYDFLNEQGMLQHIANRLGVKVMLTHRSVMQSLRERVSNIFGVRQRVPTEDCCSIKRKGKMSSSQ